MGYGSEFKSFQVKFYFSNKKNLKGGLKNFY